MNRELAGQTTIDVDTPDWLLGHRPLPKRINVRETLRRLRRDPLDPLIARLGVDTRVVVVQNDVTRYKDTYLSYYLTLQRFLPAMSLAVRWSRGPFYKLKYGGKFTAAERRIANAFNQIAPYLYLDFYNALIWARILLDRAIALARFFIQEKDRPSFTSFTDHKRFFARRTQAYGQHEEYADYMRQQTGWFDLPLKLVRDKYVVHASPTHQRLFGYPGGAHELQMILIIPDDLEAPKPFSKVKDLNVGIPQMALEVESFLAWFAAYGARTLSRQRSRAAG